MIKCKNMIELVLMRFARAVTKYRAAFYGVFVCFRRLSLPVF